METEALWKKLHDLEEKSRKYERRSESDSAIVAQARLVLKETEKLLRLVDPACILEKKRGGRPSNEFFEERINEVYEKIQAGAHITSGFLQSAYGISQPRAAYLLAKIRKKPNIETRNEGREVVFYCHRD